MLEKYLRRLTKSLSVNRNRTNGRRRTAWSALVLESLEARDLPAPLTWAAGVSLPMAEGGIVAQSEGTSLLVSAGATTTSYTVGVTDPTWKAKVAPTVEPLDFARTSPGVGLLSNGYYLVFGGTQNGFATASVTQYDPNTITVVDGATNHTRSLRSMNTPRTLLGWATDTTTYLSYAIGGQDNNGTPLATVEAYNPTANTWTFVAALPQTLYSESAVSDGAGHLYTFGGVGANGAITNIAYRYTIATNTWDQVPALPVAVRDSAAVLGSNGLIYVLGGVTAGGATAAVESYNIATNTWTIEPSLPQAVSSEAAAVDSLGRIEVLGGYDANSKATASIIVSQRLTQPDLAPTITSLPSKSAIVNSPYSYQVLSPSNPQATYTLTAAPANMSINSSTGLISWTPSYATEGIESVTVVASNSVGQAPQTYSISVAPQTPTGLTGAGISKTQVSLSWNASADPNVTSYDIYKQYHGLHGGTFYALIASGITTNSVTLTGSGTYAVTAVNSARLQSARSALVSVAVQSAPSLYVVPTVGNPNTSSQTLYIGQTGQIQLGVYGNPAPTVSVVTQPPSGGVSFNPTTSLVTYTPTVADLGNQPVTFAATNVVGTSQYTFTFDVLALNPTITLSSGPFTYDANSHAASATAIGTGGVTPVAGSFAFTYNGSPTPPTAAGTYAVVTTFTSADPSYANATVNSSLTINPAAPTITLSSGPFNYDGVTQWSASATAVGVDGVTPVAGNFALTYNGATTAPIGPGLYTVSAAFTSSDPNYASVTVTSNEIINSPGALTPTLSLVDGSATYDGNAHADTASEVGTDGVTPVAGNFLITYNGSTTAPTQAGSYAVVADFISSDLNYTNASITGTMTISQATPAITISSSYPFYYDTFGQAQYVSEVGVDGVTSVNGTLTVLYNGSSTLPVNAGTYNVSVTFTSNDSNYLSTTATGSMTIQQAGPSLYYQLNGGAYFYYYNGMPQGVTGTATGYFNNPVNGIFTYAYYDSTGTQLPGTPTAAGSYTFTEYFASLDPNYSGGTFSYSFAIYPATPTVTVTGGPFTYNGQGQAPTATAVGIDGVTPVSGTASFTYNGSSSTPVLAGTYAVVATFTPTDPNYSSSTGSGTLVINKATPAFSHLASPTVLVGTATVTLSGHIAAGSAAPGGDDVALTLNGVTQPVSINSGESGGSFSTTFNIQGLGTGSYPITFVYLGDATRFNAATNGSGTLTVQAAPGVPVQPTAGISGPLAAVPGQPLTYTLSISESGLAATTVFSFSVQWGDGSPVQTLSGLSGTPASHVFTVPGAYAVSLTATDPSGNASNSVSLSVNITTALMETDPYNSTLSALYFGGTIGNDTIAITPAAGNGVKAAMNFVSYGSFYPTGHVVVYGQSGNDIIKTAAQTINGVLTYVDVPLLIFAGAGNDILNVSGSAVGNVLVGGLGADRLMGGQGRDILIGGAGSSTLNAGSNGDILIGGTTNYDNNAAALASVLAEWSRTDIDYATRIAHLMGTVSGGLNGNALLNSSTVHSNGLSDKLYGGTGMDWYFAGVLDVLFNKTATEVVTSI